MLGCVALFPSVLFTSSHTIEPVGVYIDGRPYLSPREVHFRFQQVEMHPLTRLPSPSKMPPKTLVEYVILFGIESGRWRQIMKLFNDFLLFIKA